MKENFSKRVQSILKKAKEEAIRLGHSYVGSEHLLLGLLKEKAGMSHKVLQVYDIEPSEMSAMIEDLIKASGGTMTLGHLPLTRRAERVLRNAYSEAASRGKSLADDEHLLLAMLRETEGIACEVLKSFNLDFDSVSELMEGESVDDDIDLPETEPSSKSRTPTLDHFSRDITKLARKGKLDPVIGREKEIERVSQVLTRRKKNNPALIGEPGVGKTAIIEGLAQRIVRRTVPRVLHNQRILSLDLAAIVAGTKYRGQFEERMKSVMMELEMNENIIIFIDELHTLVGAGGASGSLDASNMFKPSLARGDIHCIGATTMDEYRKYIEKDGALDRRFQKVVINPPTVSESLDILQGLRKKYEEHHNVRYSDEAIEACVYLSDRYISDKHLPDKAIDIMDEAGARVHMFNVEVPPRIIEIEKEIEKIREDKETKVADQLFEDAAVLRDIERKLIKKLGKAQRMWQKEDEDKCIDISAEHIADVVSLVSGIPVSKVAESEGQKLLKLSDKLSEFIVGQEEAIHSLSRAIRRARTGLKNPNRPIGAFMFLGPTGVGKTELAKVLARYLFTHSQALVKVDMSEFSERFSLSRLIGAPPGYVGYDEGGELTEKVRRNPYSVVLLDEIEKAHHDLYNILLQVFDEGLLTDGLGRKVDFCNTIIIMTSNLGTKELKSSGLGFGGETSEENFQKMKSRILDKVQHNFLPELLNRIDEIIVFHSLTKDHVYKIIDLQLNDLVENLAKMGLGLKITVSAKQLLAKNGYDPKFGVRPLRREIQRSLEDPISEMLLKHTYREGTVIKVESSRSVFKFTDGYQQANKKKKSNKNPKKSSKLT
ncbi:MAG TPA: ATP-dependent Clp protease ATP-binding subunit [Candidatus Marinimicrobia bacterium]|nr:ATP-dependent Clp protease ATP-binding subunit [Candidatus Neomarinimicrobiota bacterium]